MVRRLIFLFALLALGSVAAFRSTRPVIITGPKVENFALFDSQGGFFELWRKKHLKGVVLISHGSECPMMRKQIPYLEHLKEKYASRGIGFFYINAQNSAAEVQVEASHFGITVPVLLDDAQIISRGLNFTRTLEAVFVETETWRTVYRGSINDELSFDGDRKAALNEYLASAIDDFLSGRNVRTKSSELSGGCALSYRPLGEITYSRHVRPILTQACTHCHSANGVPPTKMGTYLEARTWGAMIREVIRTNRMPMGIVDPNFGPYPKNHLSAENRATLVGWVESGMPEGGRIPAGNPPPPPRPPEMKADLIFKMKEPVKIPPKGTYLTALYPVGDLIEEDIWIQRLRLDISDPAQVHHASLLILNSDYAQQQEFGPDANSNPAKELAYRTGNNIGFNPGPLARRPLQFPNSTAIRIPKGSRLVLDVHHSNTGKWETFNPSVVMERIACGKSYAPLHFGVMYNKELRVPANTPDHKVMVEKKLNEDMKIERVNFHMHKRGRGMKLSLLAPDGKVLPLYSVPNYKYTQQRSYPLVPPADAPSGSSFILEATYDNSAGNPAISNPEQEVPEGVDTETAEMMKMTYTYTLTDEPKFKQACH